MSVNGGDAWVAVVPEGHTCDTPTSFWTGSPFPVRGLMLPHWQAALKQPLVWSGLINQAKSTLSITNRSKFKPEGDSNLRCTSERKHVGQSDYNSKFMCTLPEGGSSNGDAQVIVTRLEPLVSPSTKVKKSRIL